ncbi:hypothetical protein C0995_002819 [Termitomyces sp. Mi166|nr:hypothetical protein C0995_002819 [Termitomyces sp. Mi166\
MADESPSTSTATTAPRQKPVRSTTTGTVRGRTSPTGEQNGEGRPPTKRARKAINCEPCTSALCYQDARGHEGGDPMNRGDDHHYNRIDPAQEINRIRHSISLLESYIFPASRNHTAPHRRQSDASSLIPKKEVVDSDVIEKTMPAPGMLGSQGTGGLYTGPTSTTTHLLMNEPRGSEETDRQQSQEHTEEFTTMTPEYDRDLLAMLPAIEVIDELIIFYFEYCNWIYRHVNQSSFTQAWERFKNGTSADRLILATACVIMAVATFYLPSHHPFLQSFPESHEEIGFKFYEVSTTALQRRMAESRTYSLELIELLLVRGMFRTLSKNDTEEIWHIRGELVTIAMAMGLHRDPGKWRMHRDVAERRRWAWWHIVLMERWQAFLFGRPLTIASHHFDTQLPSYCDPAIDKTGRLYLPNIALFRLAFILGDIMDDAVSVRPVPYESVMANDRALTQWMEELPSELDLDEYRVARSLASPNTATRRFGVQSVIIRTSYYHIRFTLHRPYASPSPGPSAGLSNGKSTSATDNPKSAQSLEIAVGAADKLITMVGQSRPDFLANSALAVPGHMSWGPFHCFSAAMFFSFQLISNPDQPGAVMFRASIRKAISTLEQSRGNAVADKGYEILTSLTPLYAPDFHLQPPEVREKQRQQVLGTVRKLAFPYHDSHDPRRYSESPNARGVGSPTNSSSVSPPLPNMSALPQPQGQYDAMHSMSSIRTVGGFTQQQGQHIQGLSQSPTQLQLSPSVITHANASSAGYQYPMTAAQPIYGDTSRYSQYVHPVDDTMWGAAVGFGQGEWTQFLETFRPESAVGRHAHIQNS